MTVLDRMPSDDLAARITDGPGGYSGVDGDDDARDVVEATRTIQLLRERSRHAQGHVLLAGATLSSRTRIHAPVPGVDHHQRRCTRRGLSPGGTASNPQNDRRYMMIRSRRGGRRHNSDTAELNITAVGQGKAGIEPGAVVETWRGRDCSVIS